MSIMADTFDYNKFLNEIEVELKSESMIKNLLIDLELSL